MNSINTYFLLVFRFIGVCTERPDISIITEYMPRGSLRKVLDDPNVEITHDLIVKVRLGVGFCDKQHNSKSPPPQRPLDGD